MTHQQLLDGHWEFKPLANADKATAPPDNGFDATPLRVPSYWNVFPTSVGGDWDAYDNFGYPESRRDAPAGALRRTFTLGGDMLRPGGRFYLGLNAVAGHARVWVNDAFVGENVDSFLPFEFDVTDHVRPDQPNTLVITIAPPPQQDGLWLQPCGSWVGWHLRGPWQSIWIERRSDPHLADVFCQPSVREQTLGVRVEVQASAGSERSGPFEVSATVNADGETVLRFDPVAVEAASGPTTVFDLQQSWTDARLWSLDDPFLHTLTVELRVGGELVDRRETRFGFREFWIDGLRFRLNGEPIRLFGDSWHYMGAAQQNPAYARTWFEFAKQCGVNVIRTHAMPYPSFYFDLADEMGLLIIDESAVYGSAGTLAYDAPTFWDAARDHMRRLVRRDRNHPSIIFWSACNETVWKGGEAIYPGLVSLADVAREHDPTRFVSFDENDCDVDGAAPLHAGHYGTPSHWDAVWKRDRPLVVHEFSALYHGGPEAASAIGGQAVYADYQARLRATGEDGAIMFLELRRLGAASITPWNLNWYCLSPGPSTAVEHFMTPEGVNVAPIQCIGADSLTLNFGYEPDAPRWQPNAALAALTPCYKRQRWFVRHVVRQAFVGDAINLAVTVWNDAAPHLHGRLEWRLSPRGAAPTDEPVAETIAAIDLAAGAESDLNLTLLTPDGARSPNEADAPQVWLMASLTLRGDDGEVLHQEQWWFLAARRDTAPPQASPRPVFVVGDAAIPGAKALPSRQVGDAFKEARSTLVVAEGGRSLRDWLDLPACDDWLRAGGRLLLLPDALDDDSASRLAPIQRTQDRVFIGDLTHPLTDGLADEALRDWGPEGVVTQVVFERPERGAALTPLDVGDASAGMRFAPLVIAPHGAGEVVVCGLDLARRMTDTPTAFVLLQRLTAGPLAATRVVERGEPRPLRLVGADEQLLQLVTDAGRAVQRDADASASQLLLCDGSDPDALEHDSVTPDALASHFSAGGVLWLDNLEPKTASAWGQRLGLELTLLEDERYNVALLRSGQSEIQQQAWLSSVNNFDLCWVDRGDKQLIARYSLPYVSGAVPLVETVATRWEDYQLTAEQHKAALMLRRLRAFGGRRALVLVIPRASGCILISQLLLRAAQAPFRARALRIASQWLDRAHAARRDDVSPLSAAAAEPLRPDGYISEWLVLGPFGDAPGHALDHAFVADESALQPRLGEAVGDRSWRRVSTAFPHVELDRHFPDAPTRDRVAYVGCYVHAQQDQAVLLDSPDMTALLLGADGGVKVWLNGERCGRFDFVRELVLDSDRVEPLTLRRGWNTLLIKLHNPTGPWRFAARLAGLSGARPHGLRCAVQPDAD